MATTTVTEVVTRTINATTSATTSAASKVASQGGILQHRNPAHFLPTDPIATFIIQAVIVISFTRLLQWPLSKIGQPRVIAEVVTGIILGPSIMGRIPGFTTNIFPKDSMPPFALVANLGLVLYLFLIGLEVDLSYLLSNWRVALSVGAAGMAIPFGLGYAIAYGLFHEFHNEPGLLPISFGIYGLFIGIAIAITAFPVLCRILTSLNLLNTPVGVIVLSAGIANDVVGWILLALCVTLVNSGAGVDALYILLIAIGYSLFLAYPVRRGVMWVLRKTDALTKGPSQTIVAFILFLVLGSAFFTDILGIHAIFGAFMIGLILPHEGGFAIKITEKIEDLVSTLFLPLYFALSGLSTNLGLLDSGMVWAYVVGVTAVAFFGKFIGGTAAAKLNGMLWGESVTIGALMSCKGLVELIVLNIGLQAKILSTRTFTIFVVMALLTTFATTPLTAWLYPPEYQQKVDLWKKGKVDWSGNPTMPSESSEGGIELVRTDVTSKMLVYLRLDALPSLFKVVSLFTGGQQRARSLPYESNDRSRTGSQTAADPNGGQNDQSRVMVQVDSTITDRPLRIHGMRLMELTERDSSVMKVSELEEFAQRDPIIKAFGTSAASQRSSRNVNVSGEIAIVPEESYAPSLLRRARELRSDFVLVPWSETGYISEAAQIVDLESSPEPLANREYARLATDMYESASKITNMGVFIDRTLIDQDLYRGKITKLYSPVDRPTLTRSVTGLSIHEQEAQRVLFRSLDTRGRHQIRTLYRSTPDDLLAVQLALQIAKNENVVVLIVKARPAPKSINSAHLCDHELDKIHGALPEEIRSHVHIENLTAGTEAMVASTLVTNNSSDTSELTVIIGRSLSSEEFTPVPTSPASTHATNHITKALGHNVANLLPQIKELHAIVNLLVVQAKVTESREASSPVLARKTSRESALTT